MLYERTNTMKLLLALLLTIALSACVVQAPNPFVGSSDNPALLTPSYAALGDALVNPSVAEPIKFAHTNSSDNLSITVYGTNDSNVSFLEVVTLVGSLSNYTTRSYSRITRITTNVTFTNVITVAGNTSGASLFSLSVGTTNSYIAVDTDYDFTDAVPRVCQNSSSMSVQRHTTLGLYVRCSDVAVTLNITPQVSPDAINWFPQARVFCDNNQSYVALTPADALYARVEVCSSDDNVSQVLVGITGK